MATTLDPNDIAAGVARIEAIASAFHDDTLRHAADHPAARDAAEQPWLIAGISDGMGLHTAVAAIEAGVLRYGIGVYWEPPHFLERNEAGEPVSPVHWARLQNAAGLEAWARSKGVDFRVVAADVIMAPERDLKGRAKGDPSEFSAEIRTAFDEVRGRAPHGDAVFINSVAFGKWMCPREGVEPIAVPTVDFTGRIVEMRTKKFHPRGYEETLDTMGRNHGLLLDAFLGFGWLGPKSLTAFFTWAGGSQNVDVLEGIYGKGALGDAKVVAESELAAFRLRHGLDVGAHAMVRLPAFLSAALMGIPGGGLFGLVSRAFLERRGLFEDMPRLAERMLDRMFGPEWIRENPVSQIELDTAETLYIQEISSRVTEAQERVHAFWEEHPELRDQPLDVQTSVELLQGLAPEDYPSLLRRFDPSAVTERAIPPASPHSADVVHLELSEQHEFRPDLAMVDALATVADAFVRSGKGDWLVSNEHLEIDTAAWERAGRIRCEVRWSNGGSELVLDRTFQDERGRQLGSARTTLTPVQDPPVTHADPSYFGEAVGPRMPVRVSLHHTYGDDSRLTHALQGPALIGFARENLKAAGVFDDGVPGTWEVKIAGTVEVGDHLLTYARREADGWIVTVVDDDSRPLLQMSLR